MADRNQHFAFITYRSTDHRKDLYETQMGLPPKLHNAKQSYPPTSQPPSWEGSACETDQEGPHRENSGHKEAHFILPRLTTQKIHLNQVNKEVKSECPEVIWGEITLEENLSLKKPENGEGPVL